MENNLVRLKLKQRLNKLASSDYVNLECWQEVELLNKAQLQLVRRNLHGGNIYKEGDEESVTRIDDFQVLLTQQDLKLANRELFFESTELPENYLRFKRVSAWAYNKECPIPRLMTVDLVEEENVDVLLSDILSKPSLKWSETFCTLIGNKVRIYTNKEFLIKSAKLTHYRNPRPIGFEGCKDWNDNPMIESEFEFHDNVVDMIIDEAVKIAAADIADFNNYSRSDKSVQENN